MKSIITVVLFILTLGAVFGQEEKPLRQNEIKLNPLSIILFSQPWYNITYERILNAESSVGANLLLVTVDGDHLFGAAPYYRLFFGKKHAAGFFVEAAGLFLSSNESDGPIFGMSFGFGTKVLTKKDIVLDIFGGLGRWSENSSIAGSVYPRFGLNIGKRF